MLCLFHELSRLLTPLSRYIEVRTREAWLCCLALLQALFLMMWAFLIAYASFTWWFGPQSNVYPQESQRFSKAKLVVLEPVLSCFFVAHHPAPPKIYTHRTIVGGTHFRFIT